MGANVEVQIPTLLLLPIRVFIPSMTKAVLQLAKDLHGAPILRLVQKKGPTYFQMAFGVWPSLALRSNGWLDVMELDLKEPKKPWYRKLKPRRLSVNFVVLSAEWEFNQQDT